MAGITGVPIPTTNGVWAVGSDPDVSAADRLLDMVAEAGLPHCLQARSDRFTALADRRGMVRDDDVPLMVLNNTELLPEPPHDLAELVRRLADDETEVHAVVAAAGFGAPVELFRDLINPEVLAGSGVRGYVVEVDGTAVATGLGIQVVDHVGIFNVATAPEHRRRGYGALITAQAVRDGLAAGATFAWLQSSAEGYSVYEALGFRTVEHWPCWIARAGR
jgi:ribosomal protein S18 acetylase RimI-like enzyme